MERTTGKLLIVGFGPGSFEHITKRAKEAIQESDIVIGYNTYVDLIRGLLSEQQVVRTGMTEEVSRAQEAVRQAEAGRKVAVISSGDAGVYGMAGLVYEVLMERGWRRETGVEVEIIPGISAINSTASLLGAPVMHDACTISLSDHLTPWRVIERRVEAAASADFVIALYNPRSGRRTRQIVETQRIALKYRSAQTPVGIVKSAYRDRQDVVITTLGEMLEHDIGMLTTVIIGNSATSVYEGLMITPRGYQRKYTLGADVQPLRPHERLRTEAEPWALEAVGATGQDGGSEEAWGEDDGALEQLAAGRSGSEQGAATVTLGAAAAEEPAGHGVPRRQEVEMAMATSRAAAVVGTASPLSLALEALRRVDASRGVAPAERGPSADGGSAGAAFRREAIFEFTVSPGLANKKLSAAQMMLLAEIVGDAGELEYTPHHQFIVRLRTDDPDSATGRLREAGFALAPIGDVVQIKACDFCNMEKAESVPYLERLGEGLGGAKVPKEMRIGFNGCGMACYGAVNEDIGIVYRRGKFDLFLGGKTVGRNAHAAQPVAEGIEPEALVPTVERIVARFRQEGHPNERFHKFFKRVKELEGYRQQDLPVFAIDNAVCGD
ncbi:precorrin-3B C(17)-methyltransferase [Paenibacillus methanolicus]|uniref:Precorrin-3B C17-methyltransferase n=1 Tax=Paenibacillus methanolicus TaxID=582686 RepID=A0A5S5BWC7_9BACL|nr:precorrin-3B C(17)-methyltransferase [Paenibacillus methanolicus]TYP71337.1 precorrin-3B C17-methyltransferase [Paenibacillus methanolicus]